MVRNIFLILALLPLLQGSPARAKEEEGMCGDAVECMTLDPRTWPPCQRIKTWMNNRQARSTSGEPSPDLNVDRPAPSAPAARPVPQPRRRPPRSFPMLLGEGRTREFKPFDSFAPDADIPALLRHSDGEQQYGRGHRTFLGHVAFGTDATGAIQVSHRHFTGDIAYSWSDKRVPSLYFPVKNRQDAANLEAVLRETGPENEEYHYHPGGEYGSKSWLASSLPPDQGNDFVEVRLPSQPDQRAAEAAIAQFMSRLGAFHDLEVHSSWHVREAALRGDDVPAIFRRTKYQAPNGPTEVDIYAQASSHFRDVRRPRESQHQMTDDFYGSLRIEGDNSSTQRKHLYFEEMPGVIHMIVRLESREEAPAIRQLLTDDFAGSPIEYVQASDLTGGPHHRAGVPHTLPEDEGQLFMIINLTPRQTSQLRPRERQFADLLAKLNSDYEFQFESPEHIRETSPRTLARPTTPEERFQAMQNALEGVARGAIDYLATNPFLFPRLPDLAIPFINTAMASDKPSSRLAALWQFRRYLSDYPAILEDHRDIFRAFRRLLQDQNLEVREGALRAMAEFPLTGIRSQAWMGLLTDAFNRETTDRQRVVVLNSLARGKHGNIIGRTEAMVDAYLREISENDQYSDAVRDEASNLLNGRRRARETIGPRRQSETPLSLSTLAASQVYLDDPYSRLLW